MEQGDPWPHNWPQGNYLVTGVGKDYCHGHRVEPQRGFWTSKILGPTGYNPLGMDGLRTVEWQ